MFAVHILFSWEEMLKEQKPHLQRTTERHRVTIPVQVTVFEGTAYITFSGEACDFSATGLCLILTRQLEKGAAVSMEFQLPYNSQVVNMRAIVRHRSGFHHGLEFISVTALHKDNVGTYRQNPWLVALMAKYVQP